MIGYDEMKWMMLGEWKYTRNTNVSKIKQTKLRPAVFPSNTNPAIPSRIFVFVFARTQKTNL